MDSYVLDKKRLIVVVPGQLANNVYLATRIHNIADQLDADVMYLALAVNPDHMLELSHRMETMRAITKGTWGIIVANIVDIPRWKKTVRQICLSQDLLIIASEQNVKSGQLRVISISDFLRSSEKKRELPSSAAPIYHIHSKLEFSAARYLSWFGFLAIFTALAVLKIKDENRYP
jgi:hypothetical protein